MTESNGKYETPRLRTKRKLIVDFDFRQVKGSEKIEGVAYTGMWPSQLTRSFITYGTIDEVVSSVAHFYTTFGVEVVKNISPIDFENQDGEEDDIAHVRRKHQVQSLLELNATEEAGSKEA